MFQAETLNESNNEAEDMSRFDVMSVVQDGSQRFVQDLQRKAQYHGVEIDTEDYRQLLNSDDPRAMMKAKQKAEEDGITSQFKKSFENVFESAFEDPMGCLQVLLTASMAV